MESCYWYLWTFIRNRCQCCRVRGAAMRLPTGAASSSSSRCWDRPSAVQGSSPGGPAWGRSRRPPPGPILPWRGHLMVCSYFRYAYEAVLRIKNFLVLIWDIRPFSDFGLEGCGKFVKFSTATYRISVCLYRSPIPLGKYGVIYLCIWFLPAVAAPRRGGEGIG